MKYLISLMFGGLLITSTLTAQNNSKILDEVPVVTATAEDIVKELSFREAAVAESSVNDYSTAIWSRDIYRQIGAGQEGNESLFLPSVSSNDKANLFSLLVNLLASNRVKAYKYTSQADFNEASAFADAKDAMTECVIPYVDNGDNTLTVKQSDIPSDRISYYLVKEKWFYDTKTGKGDIRVDAICPVLLENGTYYPLFWVPLKNVSAYLARATSPVAVSHVGAPLTNVSVFDIINNRYYRGCIYQVGVRQLYTQFPDMKDLIQERKRIENELDYIQSRFYAAQRKR